MRNITYLAINTFLICVSAQAIEKKHTTKFSRITSDQVNNYLLIDGHLLIPGPIKYTALFLAKEMEKIKPVQKFEGETILLEKTSLIIKNYYRKPWC
jgi:hypothetical protein